jgi:hypothetical protein
MTTPRSQIRMCPPQVFSPRVMTRAVTDRGNDPDVWWEAVYVLQYQPGILRTRAGYPK